MSMSSRRVRKVRAAIAATVVALMATIAIPLPASAAPGDDVLVFSNSAVVDTSAIGDGGEYESISAALTAAGFDVFPFDGGDGSAGAWTTALTGMEAVVLPEQESGIFWDPLNPPAWLSSDAKDVLVDWVRAGGTFLLSSACDVGHEAILSEIVGVDYADVVNCSAADLADRYIDDATLPSGLSLANGTYGLNLSAMSSEQRAPLTVWYAGEYTDECNSSGSGVSETLAAGVFTAGSGRVAFEAWDYFTDVDNDDTSWNAVLVSLIDGNAAASTWVPTIAPTPTPKPEVSGTTAAGETLFTVSPLNTCTVEHTLMRVDPATAIAVPVGGDILEGDARQGAWNDADGRAYFPFYDDNLGDYVLAALDPTTGAITEIGEFNTPNLNSMNEVFSLAFGANGAAYMMADVEIDGTPYELALFSLDITDASFSLIAQLDDNLIDEPNGFAVDPQTGFLYAFEEDTWELYQVNPTTGALTFFGELDSASMTGSTDITALQIGADGTFWVVFDDVADAENGDVGMLATFRLSDISGGLIPTTEVGVITDDPVPSWSLLLVPSLELAATGSALDLGPQLLVALLALVLIGLGLVVARRRIA